MTPPHEPEIINLDDIPVAQVVTRDDQQQQPKNGTDETLSPFWCLVCIIGAPCLVFKDLIEDGCLC